MTSIPILNQMGWKLTNLGHFEIFTKKMEICLVGLVGQKMVVATLNSFYVIFVPLLAPIPNFIQIGKKTQKLEIFPCSRFWLVGVVGQKMVVGISNSFYLVFVSFLAPIPNFIQIGQKTQKLKFFTCGRFRLVGLVGRKMVAGILNSFYRVFAP